MNSAVMNEVPSPDRPRPTLGRPRWQLPVMLVLAAGAGAIGGKFLFKDKAPPPTAPANEQAVIDSLSISLEKVAERELPAATTALDEEVWTIQTDLQRPKLIFWLNQALPRVGGKFHFSPATVGDPMPTEFLLEFPPDARMRLCLALDPWGNLVAPDYEDTTPESTVEGEKLPDLPASLDEPGAVQEKLSTVRLVVKPGA